MERRNWIKTALAGTGAVAAGQLVGQIAPASAAAAEAVSAEEWEPLLFDPHQNETVIVLSELIIPETDTPGAKAANVNRYIDLMLHDVDPDKGHDFIKGLGWLDGHSIETAGARPFVALAEEDQVAILETLDGADGAGLAPGAAFSCPRETAHGRGILHVANRHCRISNKTPIGTCLRHSHVSTRVTLEARSRFGQDCPYGLSCC